MGSKEALRSTNLQKWLRQNQMALAKKNGFSDLSTMNKTTQWWKMYSDMLSKSLKRSSGNNIFSLTDWVSLAGWNPSNIALFLGKKTLWTNAVKKWAIKAFAWKNVWKSSSNLPKTQKFIQYSPNNISRVTKNSFHNTGWKGIKPDRLSGKKYSFQEIKTGKTLKWSLSKKRIVISIDEKWNLYLEDGRHLLQAFMEKNKAIPNNVVHFTSKKAFQKYYSIIQKYRQRWKNISAGIPLTVEGTKKIPQALDWIWEKLDSSSSKTNTQEK